MWSDNKLKVARDAGDAEGMTSVLPPTGIQGPFSWRICGSLYLSVPMNKYSHSYSRPKALAGILVEKAPLRVTVTKRPNLAGWPILAGCAPELPLGRLRLFLLQRSC